MQVDAQYVQWYNHTYPDREPIDLSYIMRVLHALQGLPQSPALFEGYINEILRDRGFKNSKHAPCLYVGSWENKPVLLLRQVDDVAASATSKTTLESLYKDIGKKVPMVIEPGPMPLMYAVTIKQTRYYNQLTMETYIGQMEREYDWLQGFEQVPLELSHPIKESTAKKMDVAELPESEGQVRSLERTYGFTYRSLFGKLLFPNVCGRVDISVQMSKLGQVMTRPAAIHFQALKEVAIHLVRTKFDGPIYWRRNKKRMDLPDIPFSTRTIPVDNDHKSPWAHDGLAAIQLVAEEFKGEIDTIDEFEKYIQILSETLASHGDASFADDIRHRRSMRGQIHMLWGGLIDFKAKVEATISLNTAESELGATTDTAKTIRWIRHILRGLGILKDKMAPTPLFIDNVAAQIVSKATGTTRRLRHVEVARFAIQEWQQNGEIDTTRVDTAYNMADIASKITGLQVHGRLILRIFGYHGPQTHKVIAKKIYTKLQKPKRRRQHINSLHAEEASTQAEEVHRDNEGLLATTYKSVVEGG